MEVDLHRETSHSRDQSTVRKKTYSDNLRLVFYAGLEGTGHHMFRSLMRPCVQEGFCESRCMLSAALFPGMGYSHDVEHFEDAIDQLGKGLDELRSYEEELAKRQEQNENERSVIIPLNTFNCNNEGVRTGEMSFPNFGGGDKAIKHVNMRVLAALAEEKGVDLRIVYLQRDSAEILRSTVLHRNFADYMREARILLLNAEAMFTAFHLIDPAFVECFQYAELGEAWQHERIASFIGPSPDSAAWLQQTMETTFCKKEHPGDEAEDPEQLGTSPFSFESEMKIVSDHIVDHVCTGTPSVGP
ncbi:unnamed protein product [Discosporangium mesarthrocarpum]